MSVPLGRMLRGLRRTLATLTPTGWTVLALGVIALGVGRAATLHELRLFGWLCVGVVLAGLPWVLLPARISGRLRVSPPRTVAGESVDVVVTVAHESGLPVWHPLVRLPTGPRTRWLRLPTLRSLGTTTEKLRLDTERRGVLRIGPAVHLRSDPLGLVRTTHELAPDIDLYVRPVMVSLDTLGAGQVRDLDGAPSDRMSMSDLAFHALREYVPGDDLRHVHWRSSARAGELLVRQYHDSRRNHASVVVDTALSSYGEPGDNRSAHTAFELAASMAASLIVVAAREEQHLSLVAGSERLPSRSAPELLDGLCRMDPDDTTLGDAVLAAVTQSPETTVLMVVTGARTDLDELAAAMWVAPPEARVVVLRSAPGSEPTYAVHQGRAVLSVGALSQLPGLTAATR